MKISTPKVTLAILTVLFTTAILAATMESHKDEENKFEIKYPSDWEAGESAEGIALSVSSADGAANVQIMVHQLEESVSAQAFLEEMEKNMDNPKNLIPSAKRKADAKATKAAGADEYYMGAYKIEGEGEGYPVLQGIGVATKGDRVYILIQTMQEAQKALHGKAIGEIAKSFRISE